MPLFAGSLFVVVVKTRLGNHGERSVALELSSKRAVVAPAAGIRADSGSDAWLHGAFGSEMVIGERNVTRFGT
jgi:hypothetical protein